MDFNAKYAGFAGFRDVPLSCRIPWVQSPDNFSTPRGEGPHQGGYFDSSGRFFGD